MSDDLVYKRMEYATDQHAKALVKIADLRNALAHVLIPLGQEGHIPRAEARRRYGHLTEDCPEINRTA